jgi:hypothetical protein
MYVDTDFAAIPGAIAMLRQVPSGVTSTRVRFVDETAEICLKALVVS